MHVRSEKSLIYLFTPATIVFVYFTIMLPHISASLNLCRDMLLPSPPQRMHVQLPPTDFTMDNCTTYSAINQQQGNEFDDLNLCVLLNGSYTFTAEIITNPLFFNNKKRKIEYSESCM